MANHRRSLVTWRRVGNTFILVMVVITGLAFDFTNGFINGRGDGSGDDAQTVLRVIDRPDDDEETDGPVSLAVARRRDTLRTLFNRAGEDGQQLTVLSLLSQSPGGQRPGE